MLTRAASLRALVRFVAHAMLQRRTRATFPLAVPRAAASGSRTAWCAARAAAAHPPRAHKRTTRGAGHRPRPRAGGTAPAQETLRSRGAARARARAAPPSALVQQRVVPRNEIVNASTARTALTISPRGTFWCVGRGPTERTTWLRPLKLSPSRREVVMHLVDQSEGAVDVLARLLRARSLSRFLQLPDRFFQHADVLFHRRVSFPERESNERLRFAFGRVGAFCISRCATPAETRRRAVRLTAVG